MNKNATKRSLLASVMALVLCVIMLVGTTFAWFTDTASTSVNKIVSGKLKMTVSYKNSETEGFQPLSGTTNVFKDGALWEPGHVEYAVLKVENVGTLALKYKLGINIANETGSKNVNGDPFDLSKYIKYAVVNGDMSDAERADLLTAAQGAGSTSLNIPYASGDIAMLPEADASIVTLVVWMPEAVGNEANHAPDEAAPVIDLGINVLATQYAHENDSYNKDYDELATYAVANASVTVNADNRVANEVVMKSAEKLGNLHIAEAIIPVNAVVANGTQQLSLTIVETNTPANFVVATTDDHKTMEVKMEGLAANNDQPILVKMYVGKDLSDFKLYHNSLEMNRKDTEAAVTDDQDYYYNSTIGVVTMRTKSFSPFTYTFTKDSWINHAAASYAVAVNETDKVVTISSAAELALFAKEVNGGKVYSKYTVNLTSDIDLGAYIWVPIGYNKTVNFQGVFDGQNHTVSNLVIDSKGIDEVGLFGYTTNGEIKNFTVKNATVTGRLDVGVVAGTPYTSKYTNITVCGDVKVDGYAYVGGVFGKNAYANLTDITVDVTPDSYVKANSENYRTYVGGVVGFMGEGNQVVKNVHSNIDVFGSTCDVGGITGIAHYGNSFINCSSSGNVTLENAIDEGDHLEIGGIAGVWQNAQSTVTFTGCSFTGTLNTYLKGVDKTGELGDAHNITGRAYSTNGSGNLIIN